mmetsp:Transcript_33517/g.33756  ORF Transcript_33517/g.33756 Transcript_33517/m.33756 type:complete len:103 (-) Transcript_33517:788-1096(-)
MIVWLTGGMSLVLITGMLLYHQQPQKEMFGVLSHTQNGGSTKRRILGLQNKQDDTTSQEVAMEKALDTYWGHTHSHSHGNNELHKTATSMEGSDAMPTTQNL